MNYYIDNMFIREEVWRLKNILLNSEDFIPFLLKHLFETGICVGLDLK